MRKKYFNQMEDMKGKIRVYARVRPMLGFEAERGQKARRPSTSSARSITTQPGRAYEDVRVWACVRPMLDMPLPCQSLISMR